jgi:putative peptidoglycan lipid II flippase
MSTSSSDSAAIEQEGRRERAKLVGRAGVVGAGTLASRVLGLLRDMTLAAIFSRDATDAWWVAFTIPNALRQLLGEGAVTSAVVPALAEKLATEGDEGARRFFARIRGVSLLALVGVTALGMVFAGPITELFAEGFRARPGELERTVALTRTVFPYIFFMGTAALGMAALNANRRFAVAAFAPGLLNVALIAAALGLPHVLASSGIDPVQALAVGALAGGFLQVAAQWPALRALGYARLPRLELSADVRSVGARIAPLTLGMGVYYVDLVLSRRFLSELGPGSQSYFSWAMRLCDFPQGVFVMALSTAALPSLSMLAAKGARDELVKTWAHGMGLAMFVALPASAALVALGEPLVVTLFQRGAFDALSARETARALVWQGGAVWTVAGVRQIVPALYAMGDTRTPVIVSILDLAVFIVLAYALRGPMGHVGVSVAVAGSSLAQMVLLLVALKARLGSLGGATLVGSLARSAGASLLASVAGWAVARAASAGGHPAAVARAVPGLAGAVAFVIVYVGVARAMRSPELGEIGGALRRRMRRA